MSFIIIKNAETAKKFEELSFEEKPAILSDNRYLNSSDKCLVCGCERNFDEKNHIYEPLVGHHVKYFPAVIAWVHYKCHREIHDGKRPELIQYEEGDSTKYYKMKQTKMVGF